MENKIDLVNYYVAKVTPAASGLLFYYFLYKYMGSDGVGVFSLHFSMIIIVVTLLSTWVKQAILRYKDILDESQMSSFCFYSLALGCGLIFFIVYFYGYLFNELATVNTIFLIFLAISIYLQSILITINQVNFKSKKISVSESIRSVVFFISPICVYFFEWGIDGVIFLVSISYLISFIALFRRKYFRFTSFDKKVFYNLFNYGWPVSIWLALTMFIPYLDKHFITLRGGVELSGDYSALFELYTRVFGLIFSPIIMYYTPIIMRLSAGDINQVNKVVAKAIYIEIILFLLMMFGNIIFGELFIDIMFKNINVEVVNITFLLLAQGFIWQLSILCHKMLEISNKTKIMMVCMLFFVILYFIIMFFAFNGQNIWIMPATSTILGMFYCILMYGLGKKYRVVYN